MPPEDRFVCRFAAEPPQGALPRPLGRHAAGRVPGRLPADRHRGHRARRPGRDALVPRPHLGGPHLRPGHHAHDNGLELFGYVSFAPGDDESEPGDFYAWADFTDETADRHPEWQMDICEEVIGGWRGEHGKVAAMTLVWGVPLVRGGASSPPSWPASTVDQCRVIEDRFTLLAPDAYGERLPRDRALRRLGRRAGARVALRGRRRGRVAVARRPSTRSISP